jgi:outer membrane protein OmpA-like peptidoglycan-associated protein
MFRATGRTLLPWVILGLGLVAVALVGYVLLRRIDTINEQIGAVRVQVSELSRKTDEAHSTADAAHRKAEEAEELSRLAAEGRSRAEADREVFEKRALSAEDVATDAKIRAQRAQAELERVRQERDAEMNRLQRALNRIAATRRTKDGLLMNLGSDTINFDFDKAALRPEERELLSRIAGILLTSSGYRVQVFGHTDDVGTEQYNQTLSEQRAKAVEDYLIQAGIDPSIISMKGFGKSSPLVPGTNKDARAKNRRVEIGIIDTVITYQGTVPSKSTP